MNTASVRVRLIVWYAVWLGAGFFVAGAALQVGLKQFLEHRVLATVSERAQRVASLLDSAPPGADPERLGSLIEERFAPEVRGWFVRITDAEGRLVFRSGEPSDRSFDPGQIPVTANDSGGRAVLPSGAPMALGAAHPGRAAMQHWRVETGEPLGRVDEEVARLLSPLALSLAATGAFALGGGWWLVGRALRPVAVMARAADRITSQNLSERLPASGRRDELGNLAATLNRMISRLEAAFLHNQRFLADASHELRTPLTILRGELETMVQDPRADGNTRAKLGNLLEEVERLVRLVERLLTLAQLDAGLDRDARQPVDLAQLSATTAEQMRLLAEDKGVAVAIDAARPVVIEGDQARLKQVVVNLLDNAIKFTPAGGSVRLTVAARNHLAVFEVADSGVGIPSDAQAHLFERFYRADPARNRDQGGAGLGLSIVNAICEAHGGRIDVESAEGRGAVFRACFPLLADRMISPHEQPA